MAELHETRMGKTLIDHTFPKIAKQLERIADALELRNQVDALIRAKQEEQAENRNLSPYLKHYEMVSLCASEGLEQDKDFEQVGHKWRRI